jgi:ribosomal protein L11 methyltransferase
MADVADEDWENNWKQFYKPMEIGSRLLVVPEWEEAADPTRVKLVLNPGLTFGTGSHATTRLCLQALDTHIHGGERVLDLGCGSGILSIAALRLGAESAFACDIDEKCVDVAYENAALNGIGKDRYTVRWGDVLTDAALRQEMGAGYDIVVANIVADVIMGLSPHVRPFLKRGAHSVWKAFWPCFLSR